MKKVVLISGGSDGLGKSIARTLAKTYQVVILSPSEEKLKKAAEEIGVDYAVADVADYVSLEKAVQKFVEKYTRIDCLINNAGLWIEGELDENDPDLTRKVIEVNTLGTIFLTKSVLPIMKKQKNGKIININSQGGLYAKAERSVYNASKWAITGFTKSLQEELAKYGISVTGIYPSKINTKLFEKVGIKKDMSDALETNKVAEVVEFILSTDNNIAIPEIGIKSLKYK